MATWATTQTVKQTNTPEFYVHVFWIGLCRIFLMFGPQGAVFSNQPADLPPFTRMEILGPAESAKLTQEVERMEAMKK